MCTMFKISKTINYDSNVIKNLNGPEYAKDQSGHTCLFRILKVSMDSVQFEIMDSKLYSLYLPSFGIRKA